MKATVQRPAWAGTAAQRREGEWVAAPGRGPRRVSGLPMAAEAAAGEITVDEVAVKLTHLDKVYFPDSGITKRELLDYTNDVSAFLLPHLHDRPYTMKRMPEGIGGHAFFQKEAGPYLPAWIRTTPMPSQGERAVINFVLCNDRATLLYLVNFGCIDHNVWLSRWATPLAPDFVLLDLDPGELAPFAAVIGVAQAIRRVLERHEIRGYAKTSGATGLHVWIPLAPGHSFQQSAQFAALLLRLAAARVPELATEVWQVSRRPRRKVYLDFRQNAHGKTIPPPYSPRPRPGAPVSAPLRWEEIKSGLDPSAFTIRTMRRRLDKYGDLYAGALPTARAETIAAMVARIEAAAGSKRPKAGQEVK